MENLMLGPFYHHKNTLKKGTSTSKRQAPPRSGAAQQALGTGRLALLLGRRTLRRHGELLTQDGGRGGGGREGCMAAPHEPPRGLHC